MFQLHPRLAADTVPVCDLPLSTLLLMNDRAFPWLILVPRRADLVEIIDLEADAQAQLTREIAAASRALMELVRPDKLNIGALGNLVAQLHVHVIARFRADRAWPGPVWGSGPADPYQPAEAAALIDRLRPLLLEASRP